MTSEEMGSKRTVLEDLITNAEPEMKLNPVDITQVGNVKYMTHLQRNLDGYYQDCLQKFSETKRAYATVLDVSVKTALQCKLTKFKQDLLAYKRLALYKQASLPATVVP
jgi:hypothetical protein